MIYLQKQYSNQDVSAEVSALEPAGKTFEYHVVLHVNPNVPGFNRQLGSMHIALKELLNDKILNNALPVFGRCFLSDASNQQEQISNLLSGIINCPVSFINQPPLNGSKLALWLQLQTNATEGNDNLVFYEHNGYRHYHVANECNQNAKNKDSYDQTLNLLENYEEKLNARGCTIENNCIRTWFFIRDVDANYQGFVKARKENFLLHGLNNETHYIASTGIEGGSADPQIKILMDAYTIAGLDKEQIKFLYAKDYMNPTYEYGVTFERGVRLDFGDRRKVYISGTASIDNKGRIVHPGDVSGQVSRMWENVVALLTEADCTVSDLMQIIVYVRDMADYTTVKEMFTQRFHDIPTVMVLAAVCRPGWLVEMECIAIKGLHNHRFKDF